MSFLVNNNWITCMFLFETARCKGALSLKISMNDIKKNYF